jgi:hypothetical protein
MDETYEKYVVPNGMTYPQKPVSLKVQTGFNSVRILWLKSKDPSVVRAEIYWNNYQDTLKVNNISADADTIVVNISNLEEVTYTFYVKTFDIDGNASIPVEGFGTPYGEFYAAKVVERTVAKPLFDDNGNGIITWGTKTSDLLYSEVRYTTNSGQKRTVQALPGDATSTCPDAKRGELFEYRSVFLPPNGIQPVEKEWKDSDTPFFVNYPRTDWTAETRNGNHAWGVEGGEPFRMFDGNIGTGWHSRTGTALPQCIVVDIKQLLRVHHIIMYPHLNYHYMNNMEVYLSVDPINPNGDVPDASWGPPAAVAQYTDTSADSFTIEFPSAPLCQYIAVVFINSRSNTYMNVMEFEAYGY